MKNVGVISLGCAKNLVDTERMLGLLSGAGFSLVNSPESADILIVNTCGFIEPAKQESINTILEMARYKQSARCRTLVVTGCLSERYRAELQEAMPEIDILLGVHEYERLPLLLGGNPCADTDARILTTPPYSAYLRIGDGCNNRCAYCAIPLIRGPLVSRTAESLIDEAKRLADGGVTELTVIAQDTSGYGMDLYGESRIADLLDALAAIPALRWIRLLYTYPDTVTPALIDRMQNNGKVVPYLDMPLQHINDRILAAMHRRGSSAHIRKTLDYIRSHAPQFILRTTMMVGFPGETDRDFDELTAFIREYPFDRLGAFAFSPEDGTQAAAMENQIPEDVKRARLDSLLSIQQGISKARAEARIGTECKMLVTGQEETYTCGRTYAEAPDVDGRILIPRDTSLQPGTYIDIRLTEALEYDMIGEQLCAI